MKKKPVFIPVHRETLKPKDFLARFKADAGNIQSTRFVAPQLGSDHFGKVVVHYKTPRIKLVS